MYDVNGRPPIVTSTRRAASFGATSTGWATLLGLPFPFWSPCCAFPMNVARTIASETAAMASALLLGLLM